MLDLHLLQKKHVGSPLEMEAGFGSTAAPAARPLQAPLVGGTVLKGSQAGTVLAGGAAMPGAATVFTQNHRGRTKASQQHTIVVTVGGEFRLLHSLQ